uniref:Uncharacterized protein n=1 Tax=Strigamia maritima TaxID=126957 RepID=T1ILW2_STRMM
MHRIIDSSKTVQNEQQSIDPGSLSHCSNEFRTRSASISWRCTADCTKWQWCRVKSFFGGGCKYPNGCDCGNSL